MEKDCFVLFFDPIFLHLFLPVFHSWKFTIAFWELRPRDHLRSWKISLLASCHMMCLILSQWKWHRGQSANHMEGEMQLLYFMALAAFIESSSVPWFGPWDSLCWHSNCSFTEAESKGDGLTPEGLPVFLARTASHQHGSSLRLTEHRSYTQIFQVEISSENSGLCLFRIIDGKSWPGLRTV